MKTCLFTALLFLSCIANAQSNFKSGYLVTANGDTIRGYINYKEWDQNPISIDFKTSTNTKVSSYGLAELLKFSITGYVNYDKYTVGISLNKIDITSPPPLSDTASATNTVLLKELVSGQNITLYTYRDNIKERFYMKARSAQQPEELFYGIYQAASSDKIIDKNTFRQQLIKQAVLLLPEPSNLIQTIQRARYNEYELFKIVTMLNGGTDTKPSKPVTTGSPNNSVRFYGGAALISSTLTYPDNGPYYGPDPSTSVAPKIVAGIDAIVNPSIGHLVFRLEFGYSVNHYTFADITDPIYNIADPDENTIKLKQNVLSITPQVIYNIYNRDNFKLFVNAGYAANVVSYKTTKEAVLVKGKPASGSTTTTNNGDLDNTYASFQYKAGAVLQNRFEVYAVYYPDAAVTRSLLYTAKQKSYQFGINYFF